MTRPGIEPRSPGPLANTLIAGPRFLHIFDVSEYRNLLLQLFECERKKIRTLVAEEIHVLIFPRAKQ